jgi:hypothetical protein
LSHDRAKFCNGSIVIGGVAALFANVNYVNLARHSLYCLGYRPDFFDSRLAILPIFFAAGALMSEFYYPILQRRAYIGLIDESESELG